MSSGKNLQEMEVGTAQSKTAVNANASAPMGAEKSATPVATPGQALRLKILVVLPQKTTSLMMIQQS